MIISQRNLHFYPYIFSHYQNIANMGCVTMPDDAYINSVNLNQQTNFPYLVLDVVNDQSTPRNPGFQVMHWHEDLQFILVLAGEIEVVTLASCLRLRQGEGVFINKNIVHLVRKVGPCHYNSFIFPDRLLKFYPGSPAGPIVEQITGQTALPLCALRDTPANREVLRALYQLSQLEQQKTALYPYAVLTALCQLWLAFLQHSAPPEKPLPHTVSEERTAAFLQYIDAHFGEDVTLADLAASASVSKSECLRCFKTVLHTTPYQYLLEVRLSRAAELLRTTDAPVSTIAAECGFGHLSHFGKCFKEKTGLSPTAYRKQAGAL